MSLVEVTKDTRILLKVGTAVVVVAVIIFFGFKGGQFIQKTYFPEPPPPPEKNFGKLPAIVFPTKETETPNFSINTVSGFLPTFPTTIRVYKLVKNDATITALPDARSKAALLGFSLDEQKINSNEYRWTNTSGKNFLFYNIYSLNFSVSPDYSSFSNFRPISTFKQDDVISTISNYIISLGGNTSDIDFSSSEYEYLTTDGSSVYTVDTPDIATIEKIGLHQKKIGEYNIYYPSVFPALYFSVAGNSRDLQIVEASFHHFVPNLSVSSTYPLKTSEEVYEDLKAGSGFVVRPSPEKNVEILEVKIGYYLNENDDQEYLMPVVVFEGTDNFIAYVSAVKD